MPIYNLILRQRLKTNYDTNIIGLGSKSISTNNVFTNSFKDFLTLCEGKSYMCHFLKQSKSNFLLYGNSVYQRFDNFSFYNLFKSIKSFFSLDIFNIKSITFLNAFDLGLYNKLYNTSKYVSSSSTDFFIYYFNKSYLYTEMFSYDKLVRSISVFQGTHLLSESFYLKKTDYLLPSLGFFEKTSLFFNNMGQLKKSDNLISSDSVEQMEDWKIMLLMFKLFFGFDLLINRDDILQYLLVLNPYKFNYLLTDFSFNELMFVFEGKFYNVPFISPIPDLIYNSNLVSKNSLSMHLSYEAYYNEQRSIFF